MTRGLILLLVIALLGSASLGAYAWQLTSGGSNDADERSSVFAIDPMDMMALLINAKYRLDRQLAGVPLMD